MRLQATKSDDLALRLEAAGELVRLLGIIDTYVEYAALAEKAIKTYRERLDARSGQ